MEIADGLAGCVVVIENCALDVPAAMKTVGGTAATFESELDIATVTPPWGASPVNTTVPLTVLPPGIKVGMVMVLSEGANTVNCRLSVVTVPVAEMVLTVELVTGVVVMLNAAVAPPDGTVTVCGTAATLGTELPTDTSKAEGAIALRVTVPCVTLPPMTEPGTTSHDRSTGFKVNVAFAVSVE
jgi:hypothetical protein